MNNQYNDTCFIDTEDILCMTKYAIANGKDCKTVIGNARCHSGVCSKSKESYLGYTGKYIVELEYTYYDDEDRCSCRTPFSYPNANCGVGEITKDTFSYYYDKPINLFTRAMLKELGELIDEYIKTALSDKIKDKIKSIWNRKTDVAYGFTIKDYGNKLDYTYKSDIEILRRVENNFWGTGI